MSGWGQPGGSQGPQRVPQRYEQQQPAHWEGWEGFRPSGAAQPQHAFQFPAPQQPTPQQPFAGTPFTATPNGFGSAGHAPSPVNAFTFGTHMSPSPMQWGQGPGRGLPTPVRACDLHKKSNRPCGLRRGRARFGVVLGCGLSGFMWPS